MKIFAVTADIELVQKPTWLDDFRSRYDKPYEYHITLKQPTFIEEGKVPDIKQKLATLFSSIEVPNHDIDLTFSTLKVSKDAPGGICIMINTVNDEQIRVIQSKVVEALGEYTEYHKSQYAEYEKNFEPHITIARNLGEKEYNEAVKELSQDYTCIGRITKIILTVVNNQMPEESNNPENQTIYNL